LRKKSDLNSITNRGATLESLCGDLSNRASSTSCHQVDIMDISLLPNDIFLLIVAHFSPKDLILSRRVSVRWHRAFTESDLNHHLLRQNYPRVRELRTIKNGGEAIDWAQIFATVASRYHFLKTGKPRSVEKLALGRSMIAPAWAKSYPINYWARHLQFEEKTAPFHYPDTLWTYEDGLLIFPSSKFQSYVLYDLSTNHVRSIDIESDNKVIRRIRLKSKVLVIEWCEQDAYHQLNENEMVYRHFTSAYDVQEDKTGQWTVNFRYS